MLRASKVQLSPDSHFCGIGNFSECQDNVHAAIGKTIISQYKFLPDHQNNPTYPEVPSLKNLVVMWMKGLPLKVDIAEGYDHHPTFFEFLIKNEPIILGGEGQGNSDLLFATVLSFYKGKEKLFKKSGRLIFQAYIKKLLENLESYPQMKSLYGGLDKNLKDDINEFINLNLLQANEDSEEEDDENVENPKESVATTKK